MNPYCNIPKELVTFDGETTDIPLLSNRFQSVLSPKGWRKFKRENGFFKNYAYCFGGVMLSGNVYDRKISVSTGASKFVIGSADRLKSYFKTQFKINL